MLPLMEAGADNDPKTAARSTAARKLGINLAPHFTRLPSAKMGRLQNRALLAVSLHITVAIRATCTLTEQVGKLRWQD